MMITRAWGQGAPRRRFAALCALVLGVALVASQGAAQGQPEDPFAAQGQPASPFAPADEPAAPAQPQGQQAPADPFAAQPGDPVAAPQPEAPQPATEADPFAAPQTGQQQPGLPGQEETEPEDLVDPEDLQLERQIEGDLEQLRVLHAEDRWSEAVQVADRILAVAPQNRSAQLWRKRALQLIERGGGPPPQQRPSVLDRLVTPEPTEDFAPADDELMEEFTPVPLAERTERSQPIASGGLRDIIIIVVAVVAGLVVLFFAFTWFLSRRASKKQEKEAKASKTSTGMEEPPTGVHDAVTQVGDRETRQGVVMDDDSVMQFGEVGVSGGDEDTVNTFEDQQTREEPVATPAPPPTVKDEEEEKEDTVGGIDLSQSEPEEERITFDFPEEPEPSPEPEKPAPTAKSDEDEDSLTLNTMMFDQDQETKPPESAPPAQESEGDETYNSMMFGGADETRMPGGETSLPSSEPEEHGGETYNSMMFGGGDETMAPGQSSASAGDFSDTVNLQGGLGPEDTGEEKEKTGEKQAGGEEETAPLRRGDVAAREKEQKFQEAKTEGLEAMKSGDYGRAVRAFETAANLNPDDQEVADGLREARSQQG